MIGMRYILTVLVSVIVAGCGGSDTPADKLPAPTVKATGDSATMQVAGSSQADKLCGELQGGTRAWPPGVRGISMLHGTENLVLCVKP